MPARPITAPLPAASPRRLDFSLASLAAVVPGLARRWLARARQRRSLGKLDADQLRDVGLSRSAALREAEKPFWRA